MEFEFDPAKRRANWEKHGIDFSEAQRLWELPIVEVRLNYPLEERWLVVGKLDEKYWTTVVTYRESRVRLISVRRSRAEEKKLHEQAVSS